MNKICIVNNKIIPFDNSDIVINDNVISFTSNGNFSLEYIDCNDTDIVIDIADNVCIQYA